MTAPSIDAQIVSSPTILGGEPRLAGHRIAVRDIVLWYEYQGMGPDEIADQNDLTLTQVFAALAYYHANREALKAGWEKTDRWVEAIRKGHLSKLNKR